MSALTDPLDLPCGARLPNRIAKAALSEASADDRALAQLNHPGRRSNPMELGHKRGLA